MYFKTTVKTIYKPLFLSHKRKTLPPTTSSSFFLHHRAQHIVPAAHIILVQAQTIASSPQFSPSTGYSPSQPSYSPNHNSQEKEQPSPNSLSLFIFHFLLTHHKPIFQIIDFLQTAENQILVGVAVDVVAVGVTVIYLFSSKKSKGILNSDQFKEFKLVKKDQRSHNVAKFTSALPTPTSILGLPIGQHISCRGKDGEGVEVIKLYTPTT